MANEEKSYGWLGVDMPMQVKIRMALIQRAIDPEDLYTGKPGFGLDKSPHVTVAYGHEENDPESTRKAIEDIGAGEGRLGGLSTFNNKDYNVLKFDVDSDHLRGLNKRVRERIAMPGQTFPDYNPHVTVAYLKPDVDVEKYRKLETLLKSRRFPVKMIRFSNPKNEYRTLLLKEVLKKSAQEEVKEGNAVGQVMNMDPTEAQIEAENYKKAHIDVDGLKISIENPVGSTRSGTDKGGKEWTQEIWDDYGYIKGTKGYDKDHVDVFINPGLNGKPDTVYILNQLNDDDQFDEHKCLIGYASKASARASYLQNYEDDWDRDGSIIEMVWEDFKKWCKSGLPAKGPCTEECIEKVAKVLDKEYTTKEDDVDKEELRIGLSIEKEHTSDEEAAKEIALDHLHEVPDYYSRLVKMEEEAKDNRMEKIAKIILDIDVGDTVLVGRFKNKPVVVKDIATDANGQPTINGRKLLALRIAKLMPKKKKAASTSAASKKLRKGKNTAKAARRMRKNASVNILNDAINRAEGIPKEASAKAGLIGAGIGGVIGGVGGYTLSGDEDKGEAALAGAVLGAGAGAVTGIVGAALLAKMKEREDTYNIPKKDGLLDVRQSYKNIYGDRLDEEVAQADEAGFRTGAPWSNKDKLERLLKYKEDSVINARINLYDYDAAGVPVPKGKRDMQTTYIPHEDPEERVEKSVADLKQAARMQRLLGSFSQVESGIKPDEYMELLEGDKATETMMHEVNHFVTAGDHTSKTKDFTDKAMTDEGIDVGEDLWDVTYPEYRSLEVTPPLSAMQHWWFKRTGDRIENDQDYEEAIQVLESTDDGDLPGEVRRLKRYREHMDKRGKLDNYDRVNKKLIPTIVKDSVINFLMGDNVKKVAEEVEHIHNGLDVLNKALSRAEGQ